MQVATWCRRNCNAQLGRLGVSGSAAELPDSDTGWGSKLWRLGVVGLLSDMDENPVETFCEYSSVAMFSENNISLMASY
jgi:hypothetical protein